MASRVVPNLAKVRRGSDTELDTKSRAPLFADLQQGRRVPPGGLHRRGGILLRVQGLGALARE
jgi:hypothetical protein